LLGLTALTVSAALALLAPLAGGGAFLASCAHVLEEKRPVAVKTIAQAAIKTVVTGVTGVKRVGSFMRRS
jgi:hypothetical protein